MSTVQQAFDETFKPDDVVVVNESELVPIEDPLTTGIPELSSYDDWDTFGTMLVERLNGTRRSYAALTFAIGDWWLQGESRFQDRAYQTTSATGLNIKTIRNAAWVAKAIPVDQRRATMEFGHHEAVASLDYLDRERWLTKAEQDDMSVRQLRLALRDERMAKIEKPDPNERAEAAANVQPIRRDEPTATLPGHVLGPFGELVVEAMGKSVVLKEQQGNKLQAIATVYDQGDRLAMSGEPMTQALAKAFVDFLSAEA